MLRERLEKVEEIQRRRERAIEASERAGRFWREYFRAVEDR